MLHREESSDLKHLTMRSMKSLSGFVFRGRAVCNYEMESSALYGLSALLGHKALSICLVIGNRVSGEFMQDYKPLMEELALKILKKL